MIHIANTANRIKDFLTENKIEKFKIFIRINFSIEVYVFTSDVKPATDYYNDFIHYLSKDANENQEYKPKESYKIKFKIIDINDLDDPFYSNILSGGENCIDWGPRYRFDSLLKSKNSYEVNQQEKSIPVVTFYSYKGGMGRTTTMVAYAMDLAMNKKKRVVVIDCDLEAPGYLNFFNLSGHNGLRSGKKNGLVEFISDIQFASNENDIEINDYIINVGLDNKDDTTYNNLDSIWLVPAGNLNEGYDDLEAGQDRNDYLEGLARINLSNINTIVNSFNLLFNKIKEAINPDIILLDSRTGFNDIFGTAAFYLSSCVIGFFGFSHQTQPGLINLLKDYYKKYNNFYLNLVFSILPKNSDETWELDHKKNIDDFINYIGNEHKNRPVCLFLHRNDILEEIGTGDNLFDSKFVKLVKNNEFTDYNTLFNSINELFFKQEESYGLTRSTPSIILRNVILKHLKDVLDNVKKFAEDTEIKEEQFFYRECMKELFDPKKFLIQGYKGTGKTYLYKALTDKKISGKIQEWAGQPCDEINESIFVNILPPNDGLNSYPFNSIQYSKIEEPEYYFNCFWQIHTWNSLLMRPEFSELKEQSKLKDFIKPIVGQETAKRFNELIDNGIETLIIIENDIKNLNIYLKQNNKKLFVLYDRLDTCINPLRWNKAVSPLINYWRDNYASFSNIMPKIFVRTDLYLQIEGTNTARLSDNTIKIEWSIGEVFGYFFKLIFSNEKATKAYWAIAEKVGIDSDYIKNTKKSFTKMPKNQFKSLQVSEMHSIIQVFFGRNVCVGTAKLGTPWEYFSRELANADNSAISLRPFINTLDSNAVDKALAKTEKFVHEIISPEIYASKEVRDKTTETYFNDLTQDAFSKDLLKFKEVIRTAGGESYRFKSLTEVQFDSLLKKSFDKIKDSDVVKTPEDLKSLIFANGIMAEKITTNGRWYRFAPIYWYSWGLANSEIENEERHKSKYTEKKRWRN